MASTEPRQDANGLPLMDDVGEVKKQTEQGYQGPQSICERFAVWIVFWIFVIFRALDRVFLKAVNNNLGKPEYNLILGNIIWPVAIQIITICMMIGYICLLRCQGQTQYTWRFFLPGNIAASTMGAVPIYQLALFSLGDQLNAALTAAPSAFVSLPVQSVMTNMVLFWMAIVAFFMIKARFKAVHYIGIALVMVAVLVQLSPKLIGADCSPSGIARGACLGSYTASTGKYIKLEGNEMLIWYSLFLVSTLPGAFGNVYKQRVLQGRDVDVWYATWWSGNFQILWGLLCIWMIWVPMPNSDPADTIYPSQTFQVIRDTITCLFGEKPHPNDPDEETCLAQPSGAFWFAIYLVFNITFNICLLWLTKRMSATWAQIATLLCTNLCAVFSQWELVSGKGAEMMTIWDYAGLLVVTIAMLVYNQQRETNMFSKNENNEKLAGNSEYIVTDQQGVAVEA